MPKATHILGVDIGGSGIKGGIVDINSGDMVTDRHRIDTPQPATPKAVAATFGQLVSHFGYKGPIGVGFPAVVRRGTALSAANISKKWVNTNIVDILHQASGQPIYALNDADAAGLAAMHFGAGKDYQDRVVLMITLGTGIGSGLFVEGELVPNSELGHLYLKSHKVGAEKFVSNLLRKQKGWSWNKFGKRLNIYLQHVNMLFSPDLILIGGGASKHFERFEAQLNVSTEVKPAALMNNAGTIGAAIYAYQRTLKLK